jgi:hypothetical protein
MITGFDMYRLANQTKPSEENAANKVIHEMQTEVKNTATGGETIVECEVPVMIPGTPAYDYKTVCAQVAEHFQRGGFRVEQKSLGILTISWDFSHETLDGKEDNARRESMRTSMDAVKERDEVRLVYTTKNEKK